MAVTMKVVRCGECHAEVDRVEYDPDAESAQVRQVADALGIDDAEAVKIVTKATGSAPRSQADAAADLVKQIRAKSVPGRKAGTYTCPTGHKGDLTVEEQGR